MTTDQLSALLAQDPAAVLEHDRRLYEQQIVRAADLIAAHAQERPAVLLAGPSGSGKTTTALLIERELDRRGMETHTLSMDDYFCPLTERELELFSRNELDLERPSRVDVPFFQEINRRLIEHLCAVYPNDWGKINYMAVIANNEVRMANLCLAACHKVNGVSKLHTDILRNGIFRDYCQITPERFLNVTNGIAYRRWLCQSDPLLTDYLKQLIGGDFLRDARALEKLLPYQNDEKVLADLMAIKRKNKERLAALIENQNGVRVDPDSIFDIQIKRLHEYKRQLLNILHVLYLYRQIKANPHGDFMPRTFIFAAKASAGYIRAKQIISLIVAASKLINNDPDVNDKLKVVFLEDYKVSLAEIIIPAADISEQISIAGKEASGTGNMKLMINGAVTIGTLDGANVEIHEQVGDENIFLFGMKAHEVEELWQRGYHPTEFVTPELQAVLDMLTSGVLGQRFDDLVDSLLTNRFGTADPYMTLADFQDYARAQRDVAAVYQDKQHFARMSLINIAKAGIFSSDRAVKEYADEILNLD